MHLSTNASVQKNLLQKIAFHFPDVSETVIAKHERALRIFYLGSAGTSPPYAYPKRGGLGAKWGGYRG